mmetsp:Transcript_25639/g.73723  ORF Transcript_25639/g.73723 Transcript_25639/m.73723 type:complete len:220 (+) Transcript_25639:691-1350(+)
MAPHPSHFTHGCPVRIPPRIVGVNVMPKVLWHANAACNAAADIVVYCPVRQDPVEVAQGSLETSTVPKVAMRTGVQPSIQMALPEPCEGGIQKPPARSVAEPRPGQEEGQHAESNGLRHGPPRRLLQATSPFIQQPAEGALAAGASRPFFTKPAYLIACEDPRGQRAGVVCAEELGGILADGPSNEGAAWVHGDEIADGINTAIDDGPREVLTIKFLTS